MSHEPLIGESRNREARIGPALRELVGFGQVLRLAGLPVDTTRMIEFCRSADALPPGEVYWAGRTTLVSHREDIAVYDHLYEAYFGGTLRAAEQRRAPEFRLRAGDDDAGTDEHGSSPGTAGERAPSRLELLREKRFVPCTDDERALLDSLSAALRHEPPSRRGRRLTDSRRGELDVRQTLRRSMRTGGEPVVLHYRRRGTRLQRAVLAIDVSGSMAPYSRATLLFAHAATRTGLPWRTFCFGTRVTEVTRPLSAADPDEALTAIGASVDDFDGGTRIGDGLAALLDQGRSSGIRGAVVIVSSDGLETGPAHVLGEQMRRLRRLARAVAWLNPLKATPGYAPLAAGMKAAMPSVDLFADGHDLDAFVALVPGLVALAAGRRPVTPAASAAGATGPARDPRRTPVHLQAGARQW